MSRDPRYLCADAEPWRRWDASPSQRVAEAMFGVEAVSGSESRGSVGEIETGQPWDL